MLKRLPKKNGGLPQHVRQIIRDVVNVIQKHSHGARPGAVYQIMRSSYSDEVEPYIREWGWAHLRREISREMKTWGVLVQNDVRQHVLPGLEPDLLRQLPPAITVPLGEDAVEDDDFNYVPAERATPEEWQKHLREVLEPHYTAVGTVIQVIRELLDRGGDCPPDVPLLIWLSRGAGSKAA